MLSMSRSSEPRGARHAALLLHAMAPADRNWMLDALPPQERAELVPLLAELEALGIERDPALIDAATSEGEFGESPPPLHGIGDDAPRPEPMSDEAMLRALDAGQVLALAEILRAEPAGLVAEWLDIAHWPWRDALLQAMEPLQRRKVEAQLATVPPAAQTPPGLRAALISMVAAKLRGHSLADEPPSSTWLRLRHSLVGAFQGAWRGAGR